MKKLLTTIALLCFSVAANAETWACTNQVGVAMTTEGVISDNLGGRSWVADTKKGLRVPDPEKAVDEYSGECDPFYYDGRVVGAFCNSDTNSIYIAHLTTGEILFSASHLEGSVGILYSGTCTKI